MTASAGPIVSFVRDAMNIIIIIMGSKKSFKSQFLKVRFSKII